MTRPGSAAAPPAARKSPSSLWLSSSPAMHSITASSLKRNTFRHCRVPAPALHRPEQAFLFLRGPAPTRRQNRRQPQKHSSADHGKRTGIHGLQNCIRQQITSTKEQSDFYKHSQTQKNTRQATFYNQRCFIAPPGWFDNLQFLHGVSSFSFMFAVSLRISSLRKFRYANTVACVSLFMKHPQSHARVSRPVSIASLAAVFPQSRLLQCQYVSPVLSIGAPC